MKGSEDFSLEDNIHPFLEGFEDEIRFTIEYNKMDKNRDIFSDFDIKLIKNIEFKTIREGLDKYRLLYRAYRNIVIFKLEELYNQHKDTVIELIQKKQTNAKEHIENVYKQFPNMFIDLQDAQKMVIGNYINEEDLGKRPLAKLTRDISEELGLL